MYHFWLLLTITRNVLVCCFTKWPTTTVINAHDDNLTLLKFQPRAGHFHRHRIFPRAFGLNSCNFRPRSLLQPKVRAGEDVQRRRRRQRHSLRHDAQQGTAEGEQFCIEWSISTLEGVSSERFHWFDQLSWLKLVSFKPFSSCLQHNVTIGGFYLTFTIENFLPGLQQSAVSIDIDFNLGIFEWWFLSSDLRLNFPVVCLFLIQAFAMQRQLDKFVVTFF